MTERTPAPATSDPAIDKRKAGDRHQGRPDAAASSCRTGPEDLDSRRSDQVEAVTRSGDFTGWPQVASGSKAAGSSRSRESSSCASTRNHCPARYRPHSAPCMEKTVPGRLSPSPTTQGPPALRNLLLKGCPGHMDTGALGDGPPPRPRPCVASEPPPASGREQHALPVFDRSAVANAAPAIILGDGFDNTPDAVRLFSAKPPAGGRRLRDGNASRNREDSRHFGRTPARPPISGRAAPRPQRHDRESPPQVPCRLLTCHPGQAKRGFGEQAALAVPSLCVAFLRSICSPAASWRSEPSFQQPDTAALLLPSEGPSAPRPIHGEELRSLIVSLGCLATLIGSSKRPACQRRSRNFGPEQPPSAKIRIRAGAASVAAGAPLRLRTSADRTAMVVGEPGPFTPATAGRKRPSTLLKMRHRASALARARKRSDASTFAIWIADSMSAPVIRKSPLRLSCKSFMASLPSATT